MIKKGTGSVPQAAVACKLTVGLIDTEFVYLMVGMVDGKPSSRWLTDSIPCQSTCTV